MAIAKPEELTPADEVFDFLLSAPTPEEVIALHPSKAAQDRLRYLICWTVIATRPSTMPNALS